MMLLVPAIGLWLILRYFRWQFLLRVAGARVPARPSLVVFLASLVGLATPGYLGEAIRIPLLRRWTSPGPVTLAFLVDRIADIGILLLMASFANSVTGLTALIGAVLLAAAIAGLSLGRDSASAPQPAMPATRLLSPRTLSIAAAVSVVAWLPIMLVVGLTAAGATTRLFGWIPVMAETVLRAGLSLTPWSEGMTGLATAAASTGVDPTAVGNPATIIGVVWGTILWLGLGCLAMVAGQERRTAVQAQFDDIGDRYLEEFSSHVWDLLINRKITFMDQAIRSEGISGSLGLDLGCGVGLQAAAMKEQGYQVLGLDLARELLRVASDNGVECMSGSATDIPVRENSLDFVFAIGVLHHLPGYEAQVAAAREVHRVLKPGGLFLVLESNTRNPLFHFYMGYLFPLMKRIDDGTEWWIAPERWSVTQGFELADMSYFNFLPDFIPRVVLPPMLKAQGWLENTPAKSYAVHYLAVLRKS
jgi:SAM-dependent methyltransferase